MICPYCKEKMEKGYIQSKAGLGWNENKRFLSETSAWSSDQRLHAEQVAYRCKACKKIIIDYSVDEDLFCC